MGTDGRDTKAARVYEALRAGILSGELVAGGALDEVSLADAHGVSRTPVREALRTLTSEGLLVHGRRRQLLVVDVSERHRSEIVAIRVALEGAAAAEACALTTPDDVDALRLLTIKQRRSADADDAEAFLRLDEEFHRALAAVAAMPTLSRLLAQLGAFVRLTRLGEPTGRRHMQGLTREHEHLVDLLEAGDAAGLRQALEAHISSTAQRR